MSKGKRPEILGTIIAFIIILVVIGAAVVKKYMPSKEVMELTEYYKLDKDEVLIIMQDKIYDQKALLKNGKVYLDYNTVTDMLNKRFYWDDNEKILSYTTPSEVIRTDLDSNFYYVNGEKEKTDYPIVTMKGNTVYIAAKFVKQYSDMHYKYYENPNRLVIEYKWGDYLYSDVKKDTKLRVEPSVKGDILVDLKAGQRLLYVDTSEGVNNGFCKVMTEDGIIGYARKKSLDETYYDTVKSNYKAPEYTSIKEKEPIKLVWHQVTNQDANGNLEKLLNRTEGVTVVSPTWFKITDNSGSIDSLGNKYYVERAHSLGVKVWALVDDFSTEVSMYELLSHTSNREKLIQNLMEEAERLGLDGINIDFEKITEDTGIHYIQFIRELSVRCRKNGIVLSIDSYVPSNYTAHYDRKEQGIVADYVIIMAYDEHHSGSDESGSVSSIDFVNNAIKNVLEAVPKEKVIIGIPFYTRLWKETTDKQGNVTVTSEAYGMGSAQDLLADKGLKPTWDEKTGQYYCEFEKDGSTYKIWLEEEKSIELKLKSISQADLAGIAGWKLGLEKEDIWDIINKYIK
ncbi:MAG: GH18 domain-containing protein [Lachnoclostridium sp.]|jgi:spore germination protein YaaH